MKNIFSLFTLFLAMYFTSCSDPLPPTAVITVVDEDQAVLRNAEVTIDCVPCNCETNKQECKEGVKQTASTGTEGIVTFETPLPTVLKAEVRYLRVVGNVTDSLKGDAFVEFKEDEITQQTITIYPVAP